MKFQLRFSPLCLALFAGVFSSPVFGAEEVSVTDIPVRVNHFQFGANTSYRATTGRFDPYGVYTPLPTGSTSSAFMESLSTSYRFSKKFESTLSLPIRKSEVSLPTGSTTTTTVGGASLQSRYHVGGPAHLILHGGVTTPWSSTSTQTSGNPSASFSDTDPNYIPGMSFRMGAGVSHTLGRFRAAFDFTDTLPIASDQVPADALPGTPAVNIRKGNRIQATEGLAYTLSNSWSFNGGLQEMWGADTAVAGVSIVGTASRTFSTSLGVGYALNPDWRFSLSYGTMWPLYSYAANQSYGPGASLGVVFMNL